MPLKQSSTNAARGANIAEVVKSYERTGNIGTSTPPDKAKAMKQAEAIAYATQRKNRK